MENSPKSKGSKTITGEIKVLTGLHIGGSKDTIEIGGNDNPILRDPITNEPYIPGSSLKGKMRSLLEWKLGKVSNQPKQDVHQWCKDRNCPICRIFGTTDHNAELGPTRLVVRDALLSRHSRDRIYENGEILTENKYENSINRITARANPRPIERVVPGVTFEFEIIYRMFDMGNNGEKSDEDLFSNVKDALRMVEMDALGGAISRGSGKIEFGFTDDNGEWHPHKIKVDGNKVDLSGIELK